MSEWISVKDKMPPIDGERTNYLVYGVTACGNCISEPEVFEVRWKRMTMEFEYGEYDCPVDATHWMALPKPPEIK